ncbi:MAG: hypothetical protein AB7O82_00215 [Reyranella sp.]
MRQAEQCHKALVRFLGNQVVSDLDGTFSPAMSQLPATAGRLAINIPAERVMFDIDTDAFAILARNLIENGLKHDASDAPVVVTLSTDGVFTASNEGTALSGGNARALVSAVRARQYRG